MKYTVFCLEKDIDALNVLIKDLPVHLQPINEFDGADGYLYEASEVVIGGMLRDKKEKEKIEALLPPACSYDRDSERSDNILILSDQTSHKAATKWIWNRISERHLEALTNQAEAEAYLALLRIDHQKLIEDFELMGRRYASFRAPERVLAASCDPASSLFRTPQKPDGAKQLLPVKPAGLGEIELHFSDVAETDARLLSVYIKLRHTNIKFDLIPRRKDLVLGWNKFYLETAIQTDFAWAELGLHWTGDEEESPLLTLSHHNPLPEAVLRATKDITLDAPVAFKAWRFLPGSKVQSTGLLSSSITEKNQSAALNMTPAVLDWSQLSGLSLIGERPNVGPEEIVTFSEENGWVIVHPVENYVSMARLQSNHQGRISRLNATVTLAHEQSKPVEFAIGIAPSDVDDKDALKGYLGDWVRLAPFEWAEISKQVREDVQDDASIIVATRMAEIGDISAWAWAAFTRVELA